MKYVIEKLEGLEHNNEDREVYLLVFLKELMRGVNIALGKVNEFNVGIDDETNTVTIFDKQVLDLSPKEISIINTTGLKSSVRNFSINSKLSSELTSYIAIGAQASGVGIGKDASVLSRYNKGLTDRVMQKKKDISSTSDQDSDNKALEDDKGDVAVKLYMESLKQEATEKNSRINFLKKTIKNIYNGRTSGKLDQKLITDDINKCVNIYSDILNNIKSRDPNTESAAIIPYTFNIEMDGLSGIKYGQIFSIEPTRLPKSYLKLSDKTQPFVGFLVYNIDHKIENNTWVTTIKGQASPIRGLRVKDD